MNICIILNKAEAKFIFSFKHEVEIPPPDLRLNGLHLLPVHPAPGGNLANVLEDRAGLDQHVGRHDGELGAGHELHALKRLHGVPGEEGLHETVLERLVDFIQPNKTSSKTKELSVINQLMKFLNPPDYISPFSLNFSVAINRFLINFLIGSCKFSTADRCQELRSMNKCFFLKCINLFLKISLKSLRSLAKKTGYLRRGICVGVVMMKVALLSLWKGALEADLSVSVHI